MQEVPMTTAAAKPDVSELASAVESATTALIVTDLHCGIREHPLSQAAAPNGVNSVIGRITLAGRTASGSTWVQFNADGGSGYASAWPEWAYGVARDALLTTRRVWVLSDGDPFGANLVEVLLY